jgi:hypothetical protein
VLLVDGRAAGVWDSAVTSRGLTVTIDPFDDLDAARKAAIAAAADVLGRAQGLPTTVRYGRVFHLPPKRKLVVNPGNA